MEKITAFAMVNMAKNLFIEANNLLQLTSYDDDTGTEDDELVTLPIKRKKVVRIKNYVKITVPAMTDRQFQMHFRITVDSFEMVLGYVHEEIKKETQIGREKLDSKTQVLAVLWLLATPDSYRSVGDRFDLGKSSLSNSFFRVVTAINKVASTIISWPTANEIERSKTAFNRLAGVNNVIGAVDGTFIPIKAPKENPEVYRTRKCNYSITLQSICNASLTFIDCFVGYPGSVSDTRIFKNSLIYERIMNEYERFFPDNDLFIIGDKAYPLLNWCIPPYINRGNMSEAKNHFNLKISQTRQVIERAFALLFGRFRRLKFLDMNRIDFIPATILASCVLHNICLMNNDELLDEFILEGENVVTGNNESENLQRNNNENLNRMIQEGHQKRENVCRQLYTARTG